MNRLIFPNVFDPVRKPGQDFFSNRVKAFFTRKSLGVNIEEICSILSIKREDVYLPVQRHTDKIQVIRTDLNPKIADAVLTKRKGILIGVQVADCVPILFSDIKRLIVGAVHAGWKGTAAQIVKKTIKLMVRDFYSSPEDIKIALGPSIRWSCYHVDSKVKDAVRKATGEGEYYLQRDGGYCIDLSSANMYQALSMGIPEGNIWISHECTYCNPKEYYSYRYVKDRTGRQGGFIGIF
ncbi:MAG: peptidoglycan editing factor PgeF [Nitrospirota bacterium]